MTRTYGNDDGDRTGKETERLPVDRIVQLAFPCHRREPDPGRTKLCPGKLNPFVVDHVPAKGIVLVGTLPEFDVDSRPH